MKPMRPALVLCFSILLTLLLFVMAAPSTADTTVGGTISVDTTWTLADSPYIVTSNIKVQGTDGADGVTTLTIEPGVVVKFNSSLYIEVGWPSGYPGALSATGTAANPITFTSNATSPAPGDWRGIYFYNTIDDAITVMEHCVFEYGGYNYGPIYLSQASPTFRNVTVQCSKNNGIYITTSEPVIENCTFSQNQNYDLYYTGTIGGSVTGSTFNSGIYLLATGAVNFSGNTIHQNNGFPIKAYADMVGALSASTFTNVDTASCLEVSGGTITRDATRTNSIPYRMLFATSVLGVDGVDGITTLIIEPGAVLKFDKNTYLNIGANSGSPGALAARGTSDSLILFTSNEAVPTPGDWYGIRFYNTADDPNSAMEYSIVEYSGAGSYGAIFLYDAKPSVRNCTIRNNPYKGMYVFGSGSSNADIQCNTFQNNAYGLYIAHDAIPLIQFNNFNGNTTYGLYSENQTVVIAENNWWGDVEGPNTNGDSIYGNVDADPWLMTANQCTGSGTNNPPNTPIEPSPTDNAVRVPVDGGTTLAWSGGDPDPLDTVTYELFIGLSQDSLSMYAQNIEGCQYQVEGLAPGETYFWKITGTDHAGLITSGPVWQFTTAGDPPDLIVSNLTITPAGNLQSGQTATLSATIKNLSAGPAVDAFETDFKVDGVSVGAAQFNQILYGGDTIAVTTNWSYSGEDPSMDVFVDSSGQVSETNESNNHYMALLSDVADMTPPALTFLSPPDGTYLKVIDQISFSLNDSQSTVNEAAVITSLAVTDSGGVNISGTKSISDGLFTFVPGTLPLTDGVYWITLTAVDTYGNAQNMSFHFTIDAHPPDKAVITGDTIASGTIQARPVQNSADQFIVNLTGTRDPGTSVWINGAKVTPTGDSPWSFQLTLMPGENSYEIWLVDRAGNQGLSEWVDISILAGNGQTFIYNQAGRLSQVTGE